MKRHPAIVLASALLLAGCSSNGDGGDVAASADETVQSVAAALGCSATLDRDSSDERELFVADSGACTIGDERIFIRDFGTPESQENWWNAAKEFGATPDQGVTAGLIFVEPNSPDWVERVRGTLLEGSPAPTAVASPTPEDRTDADEATSSDDQVAEFLSTVKEFSPELMSRETNADLASLGPDMCEAWNNGATMKETYDVLRGSDFTTDQASTLAAAAVNAYCPAHAQMFLDEG